MRKMVLLWILTSLFSSLSSAELVGGDSEISNPTKQAMNNSFLSADISKELTQIRSSLAKAGKSNKYAYINKCIPNASCTTYLVDIQNGSVLDKFATINGIGRMGCGSGQTEPGLFQMAKQSQAPGSHHPHWGAQQLYLMNPIDSTITRCPHDTQKVVHGRNDVKSDDPPTISQNTRGCMGMPPEKFAQVKQYAEQGAVIFNTEG